MIYIFGDSFVRIFSLFDNKDIYIYPFKGATMKGLTKKDNQTRKKIQQIIRVNQKFIKGVIFNFGQVDYNFSFYYCLVNNKKHQEKQIAEKYSQWIKSLPLQKKLVIGIYPSIINQENICKILKKYKILTDQEIQLNQNKLIQAAKDHISRVKVWNEQIKKNKVNNYGYFDLLSKILTQTNQIKKEYRDVSPLNIHLLWRRLIFDLKQKLDRIHYCKIRKNIDQIQDKYLEQKKLKLKIIEQSDIIQLDVKRPYYSQNQSE